METAKAIGLKLLLVGRNSCAARLFNCPGGVRERAARFLYGASLPPTGTTPKMYTSEDFFLGIRCSYFYELSSKN